VNITASGAFSSEHGPVLIRVDTYYLSEIVV